MTTLVALGVSGGPALRAPRRARDPVACRGPGRSRRMGPVRVDGDEGCAAAVSVAYRAGNDGPSEHRRALINVFKQDPGAAVTWCWS